MDYTAGRADGVRAMFSRIAGRYDLLNAVLSLGQDSRWRREAAAVALENGPSDVLDVATGTGDLALLLESGRPEARVRGLDFAQPMLDIASRKASRSGSKVDWLLGDALALPFAGESFDVVTIAYGLRNLPDVDAALSEFARVLRPGGRLVILEFPPPPAGGFGLLYRFYFRRILPVIGGLVSGSREAYEYLPSSVFAFPSPESLARSLQRVGFRGVRYRLQTLGTSALFVGEKE